MKAWYRNEVETHVVRGCCWVLEHLEHCSLFEVLAGYQLHWRTVTSLRATSLGLFYQQDLPSYTVGMMVLSVSLDLDNEFLKWLRFSAVYLLTAVVPSSGRWKCAVRMHLLLPRCCYGPFKAKIAEAKYNFGHGQQTDAAPTLGSNAIPLVPARDLDVWSTITNNRWNWKKLFR